MKISYFAKLLSIIFIFLLGSTACKVKKQTVNRDNVTTQSQSQLIAEQQSTARVIQQTIDSSKIIKKDSTLVSVEEQEVIEYDYPNPTAGSASKIIHRRLKTTNFHNGENVTKQTNIKSTTTADLEKKKNISNVTNKKENEIHHSFSSVITSSTSWIWIVGLLILLAVTAIYLVKKFNLINITKSFIAKTS